MQEFEQKIEGKHTFESKAKVIDQSERIVQPHMDQRAHQSKQPTQDSDKPCIGVIKAHLTATQRRLRSVCGPANSAEPAQLPPTYLFHMAPPHCFSRSIPGEMS
jgi:hypothetical protein